MIKSTFAGNRRRMNPVALAASALIISLAGVSGAYAQSTTNGTIYGQVKPAPGVTVVIENVGTGAKRTITPDANGRFQATALPPGTYKASVMSGSTVVRTETVELLAGAGSELNFAEGGAQRIDVVGRLKTIDVSQSNGGATFTAKEIERLPVQQTVASVVQLAPNTTKADFRYGNNAASFGGSGSSENAVYLNGFTITNGLYQVGYSSLPFGAIAQINVLTGGYGAEFGRSTGGVINLTTKSGTNQFDFNAGFTYAPAALRAKPKNIVYPNTGAPVNAGTDGKIFYYKQGDVRDEQSFNLSLSGPIIKDRLFFYAAGEVAQFSQQTTRASSASTTVGRTGWLDQASEVPRGLLKLDWHITDNHLLEYTGVRDKSKVSEKYFGFDYATLTAGTTRNGGAEFVNYAAGVPFLGATGAAVAAAQGADLNIIKYTGYLTDKLTVQALVGTSKTVRSQIPQGLIPGQYQVTAPPAARAPGINYIPTSPQITGSILRDGAQDKNTGTRFDLEYKLTSQHTVRGGIDSNDIKAVNGSALPGGGRWDYLISATPGLPLAGMTAAPNSTGSPLGALGFYVDEVHNVLNGTPQVKQKAQYIEDRFQVTPNLLVTAGLRNEQFNNLNSAGDSIIKKNKQLAPRLSAAWDVNGDSSFKVFGTAGRYHLQIPANLAVRFASGSLNTERFFTYTGVDPVTGAPIGLVPIGNVYSPNNEFGQPPDARGIAATDIKSNTQDEFSIGFEKALNRDWNGGMRFNYRKLVSSIDDVSDTRPIAAKLTDPVEAQYFSDHWNGALFNPGRSNTFLVPVDANGTLRQVTVAWNEWGFPEGLKRKYWALDFMLEHPFRNGWYGKINYTLAKSTGNSEGQQKSDNGQADVGFTSVWDFPDLMLNATGELPNSRRHQIKAYGVYQLTSEVAVSGNFLAASGRPRSCTSNLPTAQDSAGIGSGYGSIFFVCPGAVGRGALGTLPWDVRFDIGLAFKPDAVPGLAMKVDVFNLFNKQTVTSINEELNLRAAGTTVSALSQQEQNFTAPKSIAFSVQYNKKF